MSTIADYRAAIGYMVSGDHPFTGNNELDSAIAAAMTEHSKHKPLSVVEDLDGAGSFAFACSALALWDDDFSQIAQVEYPVNDDDQDKNILDETDWTIYEKPSGQFLNLLSDEPAAGETVRVTYTARHTCTDAACTAPSAHEDAVQLLASGHFCRILAAHYAQNAMPMIQADGVETSNMRREYEAQAKRYTAQYYELLGVKPGVPKPVCIIQDQDVNLPGGGDRLTHKRRFR